MRPLSRRLPLAGLHVVAGLGLLLFAGLPLIGLAAEATPGGVLTELASPVAREALRLSLVCSFAATLVALAFGVPIGWVLARSPLPGRAFLRALVALPMVLPPTVGGVALLLAFGRRGIAGRYLHDWFAISLPFTTAGAALAEAFVALPFVALTTEAALKALDVRYEDAARTLGAGPARTLFRVTLPLAAPALATGAVLAWSRALGEFGATITFAGNSPGRTQTLPIAVYLALESRPEAAVALSVLLVAVSLLVLLLAGSRLSARLGGGDVRG